MPISAVGTELAPTLFTSCNALPPEGAAAPAARQSRFRGPCWRGIAATPVASRTALSSRDAAPSGRQSRLRQTGFTLIELLVVVAIMAIATAGVGLSLRDSSATALERDAQRLAVLLESARAQSRMSGNPVRWRPTATGFLFEGITGPAYPSSWLGSDVRSAGGGFVLLGPEPVIGPQQIRLVSNSEPTRGLTLATDGVRPFSVLTAASSAPP